MGETKVVAHRGTPLWGINAVRADGLSRLLDDLVELEKSGLESDQCEQVKKALKKIAGSAAAIPDGSFWRTAIYEEFETFADIYNEWNSKEGGDPEAIAHREAALRKLRKQRQLIARRIRKNQFILQNELDLSLVEGVYSAFRDLTTTLPDLFSSLTGAVNRYDRRKSPG